jgi:hypothetical protein
MVGHLEELFPATAVLVVAIIAPAAFFALAPLPPPPPGASRTELGRVYYGSAPSKRLHWYSTWAVFAASALVGFLAVHFLDDDSSPRRNS